MKLPSWRDLYEEFLYGIETELEVVDGIPHLIKGSQFRGELTNMTGGKYHCWELTRDVYKTRHYGHYQSKSETFVERHHFYLWLGPKGSIYHSSSPNLYKAIAAKKQSWFPIISAMRQWAANKFWELKNQK